MKTRNAVLIAILCVLVAPSSATAATFCVHDPDGCVGTEQANLQAALDAAAANGSGRDTIRLGVGLFNDGPAVNVAGSPVDVIGIASNKTAITTPSVTGGLVILDIQEPTSTIADLRVHHKSAAPTATGIILAGDADDILVSNQGQTQFDGIRMIGTAASLDESSVTLVYPANLQNRAVFVGSGADVDIDDSYLEGTVGVSATAADVAIDRTRIYAKQGVVASTGSAAIVRDTQIIGPGPFTSNFQGAALAVAGTGAATLDADRVTAYSDGTGYGVWAVPNGGANSATVDLHGSVLHGFQAVRTLSEAAGTTVTMTTDWSAFDLDSASQTGTPSYTAGANMIDLESLDPKFRNAASRDLRLRHDSPLIDVGDPAFQPFLGGLDVFKRTRVRDGDGSGGPVVDLGANEYQRVSPQADIEATPTSAVAGQPIQFTASASDSDGDELTYGVAFDDDATATGQTVQHAFSTPGTHTVTLTVTDVTGLEGTSTTTVTVLPKPNPPKDSPAPLLSDLRIKPSKFRAKQRKRPRAEARTSAKRAPVGTTVGYRLSTAALVTFTVERARPGRLVGKACRKPKPANRGGKRCTRWVKAGTFISEGLAGSNSHAFNGRIKGKPLKPGRYRLRARARNGAGASLQAGPKRFRIVR